MLKGMYRKLGFMVMVAITIVIFTFDGIEVSANAHSSIQLRDGNASWNDGGYRPSGKAEA